MLLSRFLVGVALLLVVVVVDSSTVRGVRGDRALKEDHGRNSTSTPKTGKLGMSKTIKGKGDSDAVIASNFTNTTGKSLKGKGNGGRFLMDMDTDNDFTMDASNYTSTKKQSAKIKSKGKMKGIRVLMDDDIDQDDYFLMDESNHTSKKKKSVKVKATKKSKGGRLLSDNEIEIDSDDFIMDASNYTTSTPGQSKGKGSGIAKIKGSDKAKGKGKGQDRKLSDDDSLMMDDDSLMMDDDSLMMDDLVADSTPTPEMPMEKGKGKQKGKGVAKPKGKGEGIRNSKSKSPSDQEVMVGCDQFESKPWDLCNQYCSKCRDDIAVDENYMLDFPLDGNFTPGNSTSPEGEPKARKGKGGNKAKGEIQCSALREEFFHWTNEAAVPCELWW
jgi:hypothetical protein